MHALHCILVSFDSDASEVDKKTARYIAMSETECYYGAAFDWRTEDDAGRWEDVYPGEGVVLGAEEPEKFRELLNKFKDYPLRAALWNFREILVEEARCRSKEEFDSDPDLVELPALLPSKPGEVFCGRLKSRVLEVTEELLRSIWEEKVDFLLAYRLQKAIRLAEGEYLFDSQFYSVPDGSAKISEETLKDALEHPERYALVFSDYHF